MKLRTSSAPRRPRRPALPVEPVTYDTLQRAALAQAEAEGWRVVVAPPGAEPVRLRHGHPARGLVLTLGAGPGPLDLADLYPAGAL